MYEWLISLWRKIFPKPSMKIMIQWAQKDPQGWQQIDASEWKNLPKKDKPKKDEKGGKDNQLGWIRNVNVQGLTTEGFDHVAIEPITIGNDEGVKLTVWNDDPDDQNDPNYEPWVTEPQAIVWTILPLAPDPYLGMAINTRQSAVRYCGPLRFAKMEHSHPKNVSIRPLSEFVPPSEEVTRHGVWLENDKHTEHLEKAPHHEWGWMHWCEHLSENETEIESETAHNKSARYSISPRRKLKEQRTQGRYRQAEHTITYYQRDTNRAVGAFTSTNEDALEKTTAASATETVTTNATTVDGWSFATPASEPNSADWPSGSFNCQVNVTAISVGVNSSSPWLNFSRLSSDLTTLLDSVQDIDAGSISGTGLKLGTQSWDSSAGSASDCFGIGSISGISFTGDSHGDAVTLQLNTTDSYADGPWSSGAASAPTDFQNLIITS